jgi:hypothetical protein
MEKLIKEYGIYVRIERTPVDWGYTLRSALTGKELYDDGQNIVHKGGFSNYTAAEFSGMLAAKKYNQEMVH